MKPTRERRAALKTLGRVRRDGAWLRPVIDSEAASSGLDDRERAFALRVSSGVLEYIGVLDALIDDAATHPGAIEPQVRDALRIAAYELLFMGTPHAAAVSQGVGMVGSVRPRAKGVANAVLRRVAERAGDFPFGDPETDLAALARLTGHPLWLAELFVREAGRRRAEDILRAHALEAPLYLAHNPFKGTFDDMMDDLARAGAAPEALAAPGAVVCGDARSAIRSSVVADGRAVVTDLAAQVIAAATPIEPGHAFFEAAAGRGTKSLLLQAAAVRAGGLARISANDLHAFKSQEAARRFDLLGVPQIETSSLDATDPELLAREVGEVDGAFVDAPCSGLGTMRRHPERRWTVDPDDIQRTASLARQMLHAVASIVRPGGFVVYSTCTVTHAENSDVVASLSTTGEGRWEVESLEEHIPDEYRGWLTDGGMLQAYPTPGGPDGHFAALLRRTT